MDSHRENPVPFTNRQRRPFWQRWVSRRRTNHTAHYERVLGTSLELQFSCSARHAGTQAERKVLAEIERLEAIFSAYQPDSELRRWQETFGEDVKGSAEFLRLLKAAGAFIEETGGAFHPGVEALSQVWREADDQQRLPDEATLNEVTAQLSEALWSVNPEETTVRRLTRLPITLNSIAKGTIIDCAAQAAFAAEEVREVLVNIGGDLAHRGDAPLTVAIADPFSDAENAEPADNVQICNQALATSGNYRRGFQIGERWFSHVIDPRTGWPVEHVVSASVIAESAEKADVLATAFSVLTPEESLVLASSMKEVGLLLIGEDGERCCNGFWEGHRARQG